MRELAGIFSRLKARNEGALIAYVTAGDPEPSYTPKIVEALVNGGADIVELGIPFSDPIADGPTIQAAMIRALRAGTTPKMVLEITRETKERCDVPIVVLTYYNPIFRMGLQRFLSLANDCKVDGLIVPDLPIEEALDYKKLSDFHNLDTIFLATPSTSTERLQRIISYTSGFLYLVSVFGVTGTRDKLQHSTLEQVEKFLPFTSGRIPLSVGFGISKPEHVKVVIESRADGAIVGSEFVSIIHKNQASAEGIIDAIEDKARELKRAMM
jgi:tryptophan synthase alpha chain